MSSLSSKRNQKSCAQNTECTGRRHRTGEAILPNVILIWNNSLLFLSYFINNIQLQLSFTKKITLKITVGFALTNCCRTFIWLLINSLKRCGVRLKVRFYQIIWHVSQHMTKTFVCRCTIHAWHVDKYDLTKNTPTHISISSITLSVFQQDASHKQGLDKSSSSVCSVLQHDSDTIN